MRFIFLFFLLFCTTLVEAQQMNNQRLYELIKKNADTIDGLEGRWQFIYKKMPMLCVTDQKNNRMRIITPITTSDKLDKDLLLDTLTANFHSALDVKYAISDSILWSIYVHPLKELTPQEVESAIVQVYSAAATFGTTFSSTKLLFGGNRLEEENTTPSFKEDNQIQKF
ncbi:hypothetical protein [Aquimarina rhabdastrellae]